jgi:hypothetical protein
MIMTTQDLMMSPQEMPWNVYRQQHHIARLPLQEQVKRYNFYLEELNTIRYNIWLQNHPKSAAPTPIPYLTLGQAYAIGIFNNTVEISNLLIKYTSYATANAFALVVDP